MVEEALFVLWQRQKLDNCSSALSPNARHVEVKFARLSRETGPCHSLSVRMDATERGVSRYINLWFSFWMTRVNYEEGMYFTSVFKLHDFAKM